MYLFLKNKVVDVVSLLESGEKSTVIYLNPFTYNYFRRNMDLIGNVDWVRFDGLFMTFILKLYGINVPRRQSFDMTSLAPVVFEKCEKESLSVFICGGTSEDVVLFSSIILKKYKKLKIVGLRDGYFSDCEFEEVKREICKVKPDIVILGLGGKRQEIVASKLTLHLDAYIFTCGAFISQTTRKMYFYPRLVNKFNLRWAYRFIVEPRTILRVLLHYPLFIIFFTIDYLKYKLEDI